MTQPMKLPFWPLRVAVYSRLDNHAAMDGFNLQVDNVEANFPYIDLGPVTMADDSTNTNYKTLIAVQVDGWALVTEGGGKTVNEQMDAVTEALTDGDLPVANFDDAMHMSAQNGQIRQEVTPDGQRLYHGFVQHLFSISQP